MNPKRLETHEWQNTAACKRTLEERTDLTQDEVEWLNDRLAFLKTPAEQTIARLRALYEKSRG